MVSKTCIFILVCLGLLLAIQSWLPRASAKRSDVDEYTVDARTDLHNYVFGLDYPAVDYPAVDHTALDYPAVEYPAVDREPDRPAPLPEFIVDYANMIRNDIILLDNSVETRTRKRGNIKVKKHSNHAMSAVPCNCARTYANYHDYDVDLSDALGVAGWYPKRVKNLTCDETKCTKPYRCQKIMYNLTVLKRSDSQEEKERAGQLFKDMANELKFKWVPQIVPVVAGCLCTSNYLAD
uniref:Prothoracicotropic hormone n=1 Tax=Grapholita molesta TaxID=192188 RepID=A0A7D7PLT7_GRAMO|nr:prothoracicotropic hormone [Grapholita molesta]